MYLFLPERTHIYVLVHKCQVSDILCSDSIVNVPFVFFFRRYSYSSCLFRHINLHPSHFFFPPYFLFLLIHLIGNTNFSYLFGQKNYIVLESEISPSCLQIGPVISHVTPVSYFTVLLLDIIFNTNFILLKSVSFFRGF